MLDVKRMRILKEVADHGSFSAAAEALSYTQSAVSQAIATLESEAGVPLIQRDRRGVRPTSAGDLLAKHAGRILTQLDAAEAELGAIAGIAGGELRLASFPTAGATLMPLAIASFRSAHPEVALSLVEGEPEELIPRLRDGEFDLGLVFEFEGTAALGPGLRSTPLFDDPMKLALPKGHRLARPKRVAPDGAPSH
jgi:DNA-binding transcriptional LysR family regulator